MNRNTLHVIYWLNHAEYSRQHWATIAEECLAASEGDRDQAVFRLSESLSHFHEMFRDAVVKPGNVLHDFITMALTEVDWMAVAKEFIKDEAQ